MVTLQDGIACKRHVEQIKGMDTGPKASDTVEKESEVLVALPMEKMTLVLMRRKEKRQMTLWLNQRLGLQ